MRGLIERMRTLDRKGTAYDLHVRLLSGELIAGGALSDGCDHTGLVVDQCFDNGESQVQYIPMTAVAHVTIVEI